MPGEDRVGGHKPGEIQQRLSADSLAGDGQPTPLVIGQPDPSVTELFEKYSVLFPQEVDRGLLVSIDPACECREEDLPGMKGVGHLRIAGTWGLKQKLPTPSKGR